MYFEKLRHWLKDPFNLALIILCLVAIVLRFYHFYGFVTYLGDQGRDTIILKRLAMLEDFPGIGASSSVGNVFLGPFYYYFVAPWLWLSNFDPVGPAIGVGVFSILMIPLIYFMVKDLFDKKVALIAAFLTTFSYSLVWLSRFSWNPNLLPLASLLTTYFFIKALQDKKWWQFFVAGIFLSISTQLHYIALAFGLPMGLLVLQYLWSLRIKIKPAAKNIGALTAGFVLFHMPLILFDIKNHFINLKGFIAAFQVTHSSGRSFFEEIFYTMSQFHKYALEFEIKEFWGAVVVIAITIGLFVWRGKKDTTIWLITSFFSLMFLVTAFFTNNKNLHYFGALFPLYYIVLAYVMSRYLWNKRTGILVIVLLLGFTLLQHRLIGFFKSPGADLISLAKNVSQKIYDNLDEGDSLQITSLPDGYGDYMYRYYLEVWGRRPVERASLIKADELFVVCEEDCKPIGDPQWDIAYFEPTKIVGKWEIEDVTLYKLIREEITTKTP